MTQAPEDFQDQTMTCVDGDHEFMWTARDQAFYAEKGFTPPKRCREHAKARRAYFDAHPEKAGGARQDSSRHERRERRGDRDLLGDE